MFQKLRMESFKKIALTCLILLAIGIGSLMLSEFAVIDYLKGPTPIEEVALEDLPGTYVEMEVDFIYDYYAQTVITKDGKETGEIDSQEYIIPIGEQEFMGLYIDQSGMDEANDIMQVTQDILNELADSPESSMTVRGTIVEMDEQRLGFYHESIGIEDLDPSVQDLFLPYVLQDGFVGTNEIAMMWFYTGAGVLCIFIFLFMLVRALSGSYQKQIHVFCRASGDEESAKEKVSSFFENNEPSFGIRVDNNYIMFQTGPSTRIATTSDVVWIYQKTTNHRVNFIPTYKSHVLALCLRDGTTYEVTCGNQNKTEAALQYLMEMLPKAVVGYTEELESLYKNNRARFCTIKEDVEREHVYASTAPDEAEIIHETPSEKVQQDYQDKNEI